TPSTASMPLGFADPNWAKCVLATPFELTLKDHAGRRTYSVNGNAKLTTAEKKFGTSSLRLNGSGDRVLYNDFFDFNFTNQNFTIESWVRFDDVTP
ncbi:hypothetical protein, partial [Escherichia coli]|uniref:hypothetical protein n=1 Tax=Escherichia coli TaxID=562 RepID=UPI00196341E6